MFVIPKAGIRVRDPVKKDCVPEAGRDVGAETSYWRRRLRDGDVTAQASAPAAPTPAASPSSAPTSSSKKGSA